MPTYIMQLYYTQRGIENITGSAHRIESAKEIIHRMGGAFKAFYAVMGGGYDVIFIFEAPDDEAVAKIALSIAMHGNVRTDTHRILTESEFKRVVDDLC